MTEKIITHKYIIILLSIIIILSNQNTLPALSSESKYFKRITVLSHSNRSKELKRISKKFFQLYPKSKHIPDIRLMIAEDERDPLSAIKKYRILVDKYRYYIKRDYAQYRICEILYLMSKWSSLRDESLKGIRLFKKSNYLIHFRFFHAKASIFLDRLYDAKTICQDITKTDHDYKNLSRAILLLSHIDKNISGYSKKYIADLKELIVGFKNSDTAPTAIYLLGRYYERKRDYDRSYSAYSDLIKKFPRSPESAYARRRISGIKRYNPKFTPYIPDNKAIENIDKIDIHPEIEIDNGRRIQSGILYSISMGPFYNLKNAKGIADLIKDDFKPISIVRLRRSFMIYVGRMEKTESALSMKIRLAEEFGLNGNIVRIRKNYKKQYLYGE